MAGPDIASLRKSVLRNSASKPLNSGASFGPWVQEPAGGTLTSFDPSDGSPIADVLMAAEEDYDEVVHDAHADISIAGAWFPLQNVD